jgi:tetrahydromethanopterin S-methyltransferase subunit F
MTEKLNMKQTKDYVEKLRADKRLDMEKFNQREYLLYRSYGMVDIPLHTIDSIVSDIEYRGVYIYRIGNSEPTSPSLTFTVERKGTSSI